MRYRAQTKLDVQILDADELKIVMLIAQGHTNKSIGRCLGKAENTIANKLTGIYQKLGVANRAEAAVWAFENFSLEKRSSRATTREITVKEAQWELYCIRRLLEVGASHEARDDARKLKDRLRAVLPEDVGGVSRLSDYSEYFEPYVALLAHTLALEGDCFNTAADSDTAFVEKRGLAFGLRELGEKSFMALPVALGEGTLVIAHYIKDDPTTVVKLTDANQDLWNELNPLWYSKIQRVRGISLGRMGDIDQAQAVASNLVEFWRAVQPEGEDDTQWQVRRRIDWDGLTQIEALSGSEKAWDRLNEATRIPASGNHFRTMEIRTELLIMLQLDVLDRARVQRLHDEVSYVGKPYPRHLKEANTLAETLFSKIDKASKHFSLS
jgi:DNA-binding CsgD family transcriptional regulator